MLEIRFIYFLIYLVSVKALLYLKLFKRLFINYKHSKGTDKVVWKLIIIRIK